MTKQELNRDIKRVIKKALTLEAQNFDSISDTYYRELDQLKLELHRLYLADRTMEYMNIHNIKAMLRLNVRYRYMPLHEFGLFIDLKTLV